MKKTKIFLNVLVFMMIFNLSVKQVKAQTYVPEWESLKNHKVVPEWFSDAKLEIYFHWGIYSVPANGNEWYPRWMYTPKHIGWGEDIYKYHIKNYGTSFHYHDFIPLWKAPKFSAKIWVDAFEDMGAKIIGSIAEHHDGFSLWDSEVNEWNSKNMGPEIDVLKVFANKAKHLKIKKVSVLGSSEKIYWKLKVSGLELRQPKVLPAEADAALVYKIELKN